MDIKSHYCNFIYTKDIINKYGKERIESIVKECISRRNTELWKTISLHLYNNNNIDYFWSIFYWYIIEKYYKVNFGVLSSVQRKPTNRDWVVAEEICIKHFKMNGLTKKTPFTDEEYKDLWV